MNKRKSRAISQVLRHQPQKANLTLDKNGWVSVDELLLGMKDKMNIPITRSELIDIVENNDKKRFAFNEDGTRIRASQGHSVKIDLGLKSQRPPSVLFHGTTTDIIPLIMKSGINKMKRTHVHLSKDVMTARNVGQRRMSKKNPVIILEVFGSDMEMAGHKFYLSDNGVWLTDHVPASFIRFPLE